jgi:hypothetical protein
MVRRLKSITLLLVRMLAFIMRMLKFNLPRRRNREMRRKRILMMLFQLKRRREHHLIK